MNPNIQLSLIMSGISTRQKMPVSRMLLSVVISVFKVEAYFLKIDRETEVLLV